MGVKYGKFELPEEIKIDEAGKSDTYSRFIAEPFERGYAHTIGNALRRIMMNSLESPSIKTIKIEGIPHEYMASEGIKEDVTHIVLNFKGVLLRHLPSSEQSKSREEKKVSTKLEITQDMLDQNGGFYKVTAKDVVKDSIFEVVNGDHQLFTVTQPMTRQVDIRVAFGRGFTPSERHVIEDKVVDEIVIDSVFSPIKTVNYYVENTRVGRDTDYDRLVLEVTTDGRITPQEALTFATQLGIVHFQCFDELKFETISFDTGEDEDNTDRDSILNKLSLRINEIELSVRSTNCLAQADIDTIAELVIMPEPEMLKFRNFGKKSLNEIKAKLEEMNLHLGMDLSKYGMTRENVKDVIQEHLQEKLGKEQL
ncbi:MAG: DNA-directed RNA polymerase subunit alpha [Simkaniaceae bacterium]|nr:DNA-directed RNA polymerase subunit alpha [Simkaniaceae bacterium]